MIDALPSDIKVDQTDESEKRRILFVPDYAAQRRRSTFGVLESQLGTSVPFYLKDSPFLQNMERILAEAEDLDYKSDLKDQSRDPISVKMRENQVNFRVSPQFTASQLLEEMNIDPSKAELALTFIGGANLQNSKLEQILRKVFIEAFSAMRFRYPREEWANPDLARQKLLLIAAGTSSGTLGIVGDAREEAVLMRSDATLINVVPEEKAWFQGNTQQANPIDSATNLNTDIYHGKASHLLISQNNHSPEDPNGAWKTMSDVICQITKEISKYTDQLTVVINGGELTIYELKQLIKDGSQVLVLAGTGRLADILAFLKEGKNREDLNPEDKQLADVLLEAVGDNWPTWSEQIQVFSLREYTDAHTLVKDLRQALLKISPDAEDKAFRPTSISSDRDLTK